MKTNLKLGTIIAISTLLSTTVKAQETDTVKIIKETVIKHDTVIKEVPAPPPPVAPVEPQSNVKDNERPPLRHGEFGVRYMPTFSTLRFRNQYDNEIQGEVSMSHGFGIMLGTNFSKNVGLQAELSYLQISQKYKDQNLERSVDVSYLNIPILLSLNTDKTRIVNLNFVAGPQFGINIGSSISTTGTEDTETIRATVGASGTDIGLAYGTGLEIALNKMHTVRLDFGYRGFYGLVDGNANQSSKNPDTYNVLIRTSRQTQGAYAGLTLCF
ncbi:MAG: porin family protein [Bacteroidota bacterium]